jgi:hypothetical protein
MEFGDGTAPLSLSTLPNNGIVQHTYNLIAGQEDVFNPTLTVTNKNGCSKTIAIAPLKLKGQMTVVCLDGMRIRFSTEQVKTRGMTVIMLVST